jgi:hypothetical protein
VRASWTRRPSSGSGCSGARRRLRGRPAPARAAAFRDRARPASPRARSGVGPALRRDAPSRRQPRWFVCETSSSVATSRKNPPAARRPPARTAGPGGPALYMPALNAIRLNPEFKAKYEAMVKAGKPAKVAIVAIMRKLLILANALIRDQRKWPPLTRRGPAEHREGC